MTASIVMRATAVVIGALALGPFAADRATADTLFLRSGKTLKIEALACDAGTCVATLAGGDAEVRALDVVRVEPDEEVDLEPTGRAEPVPTSTIDSSSRRTIEQIVADAAAKYALPRSLVRAVANVESSMDPAAVSRKGAQGVMQLMPGTAREMGVQNAFDPAENIDAGARLLRLHLEKYQGRLAEALAAYNAGPGAVARHKGVPPYLETHGYIRRVVRDFEKGEAQVAALAPTARKK